MVMYKYKACLLFFCGAFNYFDYFDLFSCILEQGNEDEKMLTIIQTMKHFILTIFFPGFFFFCVAFKSLQIKKKNCT